MSQYHINTKEFMVGATVGSLLGSVAALLMTPQSGKKFREEICDAYCSMSDKTHDLANRGKSFAKNVGSQASDWANRARSMMSGENSEEMLPQEAEQDATKDLLIGGLAGAVLGAAIGLLMAPKSGEELRHDLAETYEEMSDKTQQLATDVSKRGKTFAKTASSKANKWFHFAQQLVNELTDNTQETGEDLIEKAKGLIPNRRAHEIMDWAQLGLRLWKGMSAKD